MIDAGRMVYLQDAWIVAWHEDDCRMPEAEDEMEQLVLEEHRSNYDLWHEEDKARDPAASDAEIARVKRTIDGFNQRRNDLMERIDGWLLERVGAQSAEAPLNSETPGLMIDRLSILSLKIFHTAEEAVRETASEEHRRRNVERLRLLLEQRKDLGECLAAVMREVSEGRRRFKVYRQMKMYNDPELNPKVYGRKGC